MSVLRVHHPGRGHGVRSRVSQGPAARCPWEPPPGPAGAMCRGDSGHGLLIPRRLPARPPSLSSGVPSPSCGRTPCAVSVTSRLREAEPLRSPIAATPTVIPEWPAVSRAFRCPQRSGLARGAEPDGGAPRADGVSPLRGHGLLSLASRCTRCHERPPKGPSHAARPKNLSPQTRRRLDN